MGVVTVWEVECKKGPGRSSWCVLHPLAGAFLGEIPLFPWNTSVASCLGQMVDAVCSFLNGTGFAQTSCAIQTLPSISAFLPSNFLLILWPHPSVCSWNLCFLVPNCYFYSSLLLWPDLLSFPVHNDNSWRLCWTPGRNGIDVFFDVLNCLETPGSPRFPSMHLLLSSGPYLILAWCSFCLFVLFSFYLQLVPGNNGADYVYFQRQWSTCDFWPSLSHWEEFSLNIPVPR